ncbi:hypothetical protein [Xanthocytophaga flava]|nr:hypothetical protein [Xanthocytophaga flavus]MDJ1473298.1 hypothetical protein [Xanthocytophaga flavus]
MDSSYVPKVLGTRPQFPGGKGCLDNFIKERIQIPANFTPDSLSEFNNISIESNLDSAGKIIKYKIIQHLPNCATCDIEALRLVQQMPTWIPAKGERIGGVVRNIPAELIIRINFTPGYYENTSICEVGNKNK